MAELIIHYPRGHERHAFAGHPERPERVEAVVEGLQKTGCWDRAELLEPLELDTSLLEAVHSPAYLQVLQRASAGGRFLDGDTYTTADSWDLAKQAAGGAAAVAAAVWEGKGKVGFALSRPPGHHATTDRGMGFCLLNNVALAGEHLIREKGAERLAVIDIDLHHGNGTQDIFWERDDVLYLSTHQYPFYPGTGSADQVGEGAGAGWTLNLPLPAGCGDQAFREITRKVILPQLDRAKPQMLLISFGFDAHFLDPLGNLQLTGKGYYRLIRELKGWADDSCQGRIALFLEGGYDLRAGRICGGAAAAALLGEEWQDPLELPPQPENDAWREVVDEAAVQVNQFGRTD